MAQFGTGALAITPGAAAVLQRAGIEPLTLVARHVRSDYGDPLSPEDAETNNAAVRRNRGTVYSSYTLPSGDVVWVISNLQDEPALAEDPEYHNTVVLLPDEY